MDGKSAAKIEDGVMKEVFIN